MTSAVDWALKANYICIWNRDWVKMDGCHCAVCRELVDSLARHVCWHCLLALFALAFFRDWGRVSQLSLSGRHACCFYL